MFLPETPAQITLTHHSKLQQLTAQVRLFGINGFSKYKRNVLHPVFYKVNFITVNSDVNR